MFIPDTQVKSWVNTDHIEALGNYTCYKKPDKIIFAGDWWDMPSLSSYDLGKKAGEGTRYIDDINAGIRAMERFFAPLDALNKKMRKKHLPIYKPELHFLIGNHEQRIMRHVSSYPILEGKLSYADFQLHKRKLVVHDFLSVLECDGILYSHYFPRGPSGQVMQTVRGAPSAAVQVKREMHSCSSGHKQGIDIHYQQAHNGLRIGLIAGSFYSHDENYLSPQGTGYWRGVVYKHQVKNGMYDPMFISLEYLINEWY